MPAIAQQARAYVESVPAPVGGWNARDSIANMEPTDAIQLDNLVPTVSSCVLRGGYSKWATGLSGKAQTLMNYAAGGTTKLYAITSAGSLYDVTASGAVGTAAVTGLSGGYWEYVNFATTGGNFLYSVNSTGGVDKPILWDGASWERVDGASSHAVTGIDTKLLANITVFKNRIWFIERNTLKAWYLPTSQVGGAAQYIDLRGVAKFGGHIVDLDTWTIDAGYGIDDNLVFITSMGEVIIYRGTDPSNASTWSLTGVWKLGSPIGDRAMMKYGGDLLILTYDGLIPMAQALQSSRLDPRVALSNKIQGAITEATTQYGSHTSTGWQIFYTAKNNAVWVNVPVQDDLQEQYVMNTITQSWCRFTGWGAYCWETFNDDPYFGGNGFVAKAWTTDYKDNLLPIKTTALQAFNYFGSRGVKKYFTRARPTLFTDGTPAVNIGMNVDFNMAGIPTPVELTDLPSAGLWGSGLWGSAVWGGGMSVQNNWQGITGLGYCGGIVLTSATNSVQLEWASTDVVFQRGWGGI